MNARELVQFGLTELPGLARSLARIRLREVRETKNPKGPAVLIKGGYASRKPLYVARQCDMEQAGLRAVLGEILAFSNLEKRVRVVEKEILENFRPGESITGIGNSLGGVDLIATAILSPVGRQLKHIFTLGTPILGCPFTPLRLAIRLTEGISEGTLQKHRRQFFRHAHKVTAITAPFDQIAPASHCVLPRSGMKHIDLGVQFPDLSIGHMDLISEKRIWDFLIELVLTAHQRYQKAS